MSSLEDPVLTLAALPADIIRMIIGSQPLYTVENARLISPRWNPLVLNHLFANGNDPPVIDYLYWCVGPLLTSTLFIAISDRHKYYFGVEKWKTYRRSGPGRVTLQFETYFGKFPVSERVDMQRRLVNRINRLLGLSSLIEKNLIQLDSIEMGSSTEINSVHLAMNGFAINELSFTGVSSLHKYTKEISTLIVANRVQRLVLEVNYARDLRNGNFFTDAAQHMVVQYSRFTQVVN